VKPKGARTFLGSVGLMGSYPNGKLLARNGTTVIEDVNDFGQEWQVLDSEPMLFHSVEGAQHPAKCEMPTEANASVDRRRRLGENTISDEDAARACSRVSAADRDSCIFDVLATNDLTMAGSY
jgi:hypothetical protein